MARASGLALISVICTRIIAAKVAEKFPQRYTLARVRHTKRAGREKKIYLKISCNRHGYRLKVFLTLVLSVGNWSLANRRHRLITLSEGNYLF